MSTANSSSPVHCSAVAVSRITALWALSESALGGILHALRVPLMGLVMAGTAVILISLIANYARHPREILKATLLVLMIKAIGSPHTPVVGYIAVAFQGLFAFCVYSLRRPGKVSTILFAVGALLETALQRLLTLTIFFGATLWEGIDEWGGWILQRYFPNYVDAEFSLAMSLIAFYVGIYAVGGLLVGWMAYRLPAKIVSEQQAFSSEAILSVRAQLGTNPENLAGTQEGKKIQLIEDWGKFWRTASLVFLVYLCSVYMDQSEFSPLLAAAGYAVRTVALLAAWFFLLGPVLGRALRRWLVGKSGRHNEELNTLIDAVPRLQVLAKAEFKALQQTHRGFGLYRRWVPRVLAMSLVV